MLQHNRPALDIAKIAEGLFQDAQVDIFLLGVAGGQSTPTRGILVVRWAQDPTGDIAAAPAAIARKSRRLILRSNS